MKLTNCTNTIVEIQGRSEKDFELALQVALSMEVNTEYQLLRAAQCDFEWWVQLCSRDSAKQAEEWRDCYREAKADLLQKWSANKPK